MYYQESITDELTGLYNRRFFLRRASQETNASFRYKFPVSIILCDIDNFKKVNDNYGHLVGDHVLQAFSKLLKKCTRESDVLARFGGEEFIIMLPQTDKNGAYVLAERMRQETEALSVDESKKAQDVKFTASFGVTTCTSNNSIEQNIHLVDEALYSAKESGKNRVIITEAQETNLDDSL
jgi:diguanylate cyclase (GGDEF)-like protein